MIDERGTPVIERGACEPLPDEAATVAAVDALVAAELADLTGLWHTWVPDVEVLAADLPEWLAALAALGGKRFRPRLAHWAFVAAGGRVGSAYDDMVRAAAALELLHLFALVHDDVIDCSATRRGLPTVHRLFAERHRQQGWRGSSEQFGLSAAILLGDLALSWADDIVSLFFLAAAIFREFCF